MNIEDESRPLPQIGVGCMIMRNNQILLGLRKSAHGAATYGWIGGHLEFGETLEECAVRKIYEETGLAAASESLRLLCVSNVREYNKHYIDIEFIIDGIQGEPRILKSTIESWGWYDLDNLPFPLFKPVEFAINSYHTKQIYNP